MKTLLILVLMALATATSRAEVFTGEHLNQPFTIHGRLCWVANGTPGFRIWIVGSKRMLYVSDDSAAFARVNKFLGDGDGWFTHEIYADFTVEPMASDIKGHMRPVRILSIKRVVITKDGKVIAMRPEL